MQAEPVTAKIPRDGSVAHDFGFELGQVADVVDPFLKAPNETRRQAVPAHA